MPAKKDYEGHAIKYGRDPAVWVVKGGERVAAETPDDYKGLPFTHVTLEELEAIPVAKKKSGDETGKAKKGDKE